MSWILAVFGYLPAWPALATWDKVARLAPIGTACLALVAAGFALWSIQMQKQIARRRAAIDFFIKTEMDKPMVEAYGRFREAVGALRQTSDLRQFIDTDHYEHMRAYLNVHELVALGVRKKVFDKAVCYHFWSGVLTRDYSACEKVIEDVVAGDDAAATYYELRQLNKQWDKKLARWNKRHGRKAS